VFEAEVRKEIEARMSEFLTKTTWKQRATGVCGGCAALQFVVQTCHWKMQCSLPTRDDSK